MAPMAVAVFCRDTGNYPPFDEKTVINYGIGSIFVATKRARWLLPVPLDPTKAITLIHTLNPTERSLIIIVQMI